VANAVVSSHQGPAVWAKIAYKIDLEELAIVHIAPLGGVTEFYTLALSYSPYQYYTFLKGTYASCGFECCELSPDSGTSQLQSLQGLSSCSNDAA
jgi:hypothetical protein